MSKGKPGILHILGLLVTIFGFIGTLYQRHADKKYWEEQRKIPIETRAKFSHRQWLQSAEYRMHVLRIEMLHDLRTNYLPGLDTTGVVLLLGEPDDTARFGWAIRSMGPNDEDYLIVEFDSLGLYSGTHEEGIGYYREGDSVQRNRKTNAP